MAKKFKFHKNSEVPSGKCKGQRLCQVSNEDTAYSSSIMNGALAQIIKKYDIQ
jgi:hypothetical protein